MKELTFIHCLIAWSLLLTCIINARSTLDVCKRIPIHTLAPKANGTGGFKLSVKELKDDRGYTPGATYTVEINGTKPGHSVFLGFMLISVQTNATDETESVGTFVIPKNGRVRFGPRCSNNVVTHRYLSMKRGIAIKWQAPPRGVGCIQLRTAVIETPGTWYKDVDNLTLEICEDNQESISTPLKDATANVEVEQGCCACGGAQYNMHFQGIWSRQTHPKDFPTDPLRVVSLHWSRILGASHTDDYTIWEYGKKASMGVKEMCEFGHSYHLSQDMKENDKKIKTVIRTTPLWGEKSIKGFMEANFFVDQYSHLVSLLSMIGPSPDWCVGVSKLDLCMQNCTWADKLEVDLYPWDAGTDSGTTYFDRNIASQPKENIHRLGNRHSTFSNTPFDTKYELLPLARLTLTKKDDLPCDDSTHGSNSGESAVSNSVLIERMKMKMMMKKKIEMEKCATTQWTEWGPCDISCGTGKQMRRRHLKNLQITQAACNVELVEQKSCQGPCRSGGNERTGPKELSDNYVIRHAEFRNNTDVCAVTAWSDWSTCSVTCGMGMTERWRMFLHKNRSDLYCKNKPLLMERDLCFGPFDDCRKAFLMKNFTAICSLPSNVGQCRGEYRRWYYNKEHKSCIEFTYGGCRGNENNFKSRALCQQSCENAMAGQNEVVPSRSSPEYNTGNRPRPTSSNVRPNPNTRPNETALQRKLRKKRLRKRKNKNKKRLRSGSRKRNRNRNNRNRAATYSGPAVNCVVTAWTSWSPCSVTCGKGLTVKTRTIERQPENGGRRCPRKLQRKKKCRMPEKCPVDCLLSEWGEWSSCSCGDNSVQKRRKTIIKRPKRGGMDCPPRREKRFCTLPNCPQEEMVKMMRDAGYQNQRWYP